MVFIKVNPIISKMNTIFCEFFLVFAILKAEFQIHFDTPQFCSRFTFIYPKLLYQSERYTY